MINDYWIERNWGCRAETWFQHILQWNDFYFWKKCSLRYRDRLTISLRKVLSITIRMRQNVYLPSLYVDRSCISKILSKITSLLKWYIWFVVWTSLCPMPIFCTLFIIVINLSLCSINDIFKTHWSVPYESWKSATDKTWNKIDFN